MRLPLALAALLLAAACSSEPKRTDPPADAAADTAEVTSTEPSQRHDEARPASASLRSDAPAGKAAPAAGPTQGTLAPQPAQPASPAERDPRVDRERIIQQATEEDRPSGGSEARIEPEQPVYKPHEGILPRYSVRTIDRRDPSPAPDSSVMKFVPGSRIDLPPPPPKPPEHVEGKNEPGESLLLPREANTGK